MIQERRIRSCFCRRGACRQAFHVSNLSKIRQCRLADATSFSFFVDSKSLFQRDRKRRHHTVSAPSCNQFQCGLVRFGIVSRTYLYQEWILRSVDFCAEDRTRKGGKSRIYSVISTGNRAGSEIHVFSRASVSHFIC